MRGARILAAHEGTSVSAMLSRHLAQLVREDQAYEQARRRAIARLRKGLDLRWTAPRSRDELHER